MRLRWGAWVSTCILFIISGPPCTASAPDPPGVRLTLQIPRVLRPPVLEDFLEMKPAPDLQGLLAKVEGFIQRRPSDGQPSTQRTEVYLGYDDKHLYVVFVAFDSEPGKIRARMARRENISDEDEWVEVMLDTFNDQRRGYLFDCNPLGVQWDALWSESGSEDPSFDTVWDSRGRLTDQGYLVWMAIPFKSLRFPSQPEQTWGIMFSRWLSRVPEYSSWPHLSARIQGRMNQAASLQGLRDISPGRNLQFIPYASFRSFRALDTRDAARPHFQTDHADPDAGLDAKFVFRDSLVLDAALNPDFSQVESDEPQVTVNRRFEVFFPEKRPFFLENASYFQTPINLVFTRRIADPQFGARLTGKVGPYALGAFVIDDQSPGKLVPVGHPRQNRRALFGILRLSRDVFRQSSLGLIYTDREFDGDYNRVGGLDGRIKLSPNWVAEFQAVTSWTRSTDDNGVVTRSTGPAYEVELSRSGRQLQYELAYTDISPGFRTDLGFVRRRDIRQVRHEVDYRFRPEGKYLIAWGPRSETNAVFDHSGTRLDLAQELDFTWEMVGQTELGFFADWGHERLRPVDFPALPANRDFSRKLWGFFFVSRFWRPLSLAGDYAWGTSINFVPAAGIAPVLASVREAELALTLRPLNPLRIDNTYFYTRLDSRGHDASILNNHILRSKWSYQFTRELSLRVILQYDALLANPDLTSLQTAKNFNADFLLTYLINPWTAFYAGYNGNAQNLFLCEGPGRARPDCPDLALHASEVIRPRSQFINDARQFFVKFSYLFRF